MNGLDRTSGKVTLLGDETAMIAETAPWPCLADYLLRFTEGNSE